MVFHQLLLLEGNLLTSVACVELLRAVHAMRCVWCTMNERGLVRERGAAGRQRPAAVERSARTKRGGG